MSNIVKVQIALAVASLTFTTAALAQSDYRTDLQLGTAQPGGSYFALGAELLFHFRGRDPRQRKLSAPRAAPRSSFRGR